MDSWFENIGDKVKKLAMAVCAAGVAGSVISGIIFMISGSKYGFWIGLLCIAGGSLVSWLGSWVTYAIGVAAENSEQTSSRVQQLQKQLDELKKNQPAEEQPVQPVRKTAETRRPVTVSQPAEKPAQAAQLQKTAADEQKEERKTVREALEYALCFSTDSGMKNYLNSQPVRNLVAYGTEQEIQAFNEAASAGFTRSSVDAALKKI